MDVFKDDTYPFTITVYKDGENDFRAVSRSPGAETESPPVRGRTGAEALGRLVHVLLTIQITIEADALNVKLDD